MVENFESTTSTLEKRIILSKSDGEIIEVINYVILCSLIGLFGIVANIINIIIFYKQGFTSTVNMSLFGIAISDLACLITLQWFCLCMNPLFENSDIPFEAREFQYLTGGLFHVCFGRITSWITAFVSVERCLGITIPLKVKQIITPRRTAIALCAIYIVNILAFAPEYFAAHLEWKFYAEKNKTLIGMVYDEDQKVAGILIFILTPTLGLMSFVIVIIFTAILITKLKQKSKWRLTVTSDSEQSGSLSQRDKKTVKMVVALTTVLIVCYTPGTIVSTVTVLEPKFHLLGDYLNLYMAVWSFPFVFQAVNSSVNIIFYYRMSSNYRQTFLQLFSFSSSSKIIASTSE